MQSSIGQYKTRQDIILAIALISCLFLSACTNNAEVIPSSNQQDSKVQLLAEPTVLKDSKSFKSTYIAPESLAKELNAPVNDFTNTLSATERKQLDDKILAINDEGILQVGVAIVSTTGAMSTFDYAMSVANEWALGSSEYSNGLFVLIAIGDRNIYILTGTDIEDTLTDDRVKNVIDKEITPYFSDGNYATGLSKGIDALVEQMRQNQ